MTALVMMAILLAGVLGYRWLPVSDLPTIDFPTVQVRADLPGASAETMASAVAAPLERQFGQIAGVTEMTSQSTLGQTSVTLQFDLDRDMPIINSKVGFVDAVNPDLSKFKARGGKLLLYAGWGDTTISKSNLSTTLLCWSALHLVGTRCAASEAWYTTQRVPTIDKANLWITAHVGSLEPKAIAKAVIARYGKDKTFSVPILMPISVLVDVPIAWLTPRAAAARCTRASSGARRCPPAPSPRA